MILKISFCILALAVSLEASSEYSGIISRLYKKATDENRPLVLVLDNSDKGSVKEVLTSPKQQNSDRTISSQIQLLDLLSKKLNPVKKERKVPVPVYDHPITDHKHSDLHRLQERLERDIRERKERRLKKQAEKERSLYRDEDDVDRKRDSYQLRADSNDEKRVNFKADDRKEGLQTKQQDREEKKALRSSVIKSLLRTYNDLNCEAKDECKDECGSGKGCKDKCEDKFQCEDSKSSSGGCNEGNDTCEQEDENISTRGILYEPEPTEKCKRC